MNRKITFDKKEIFYFLIMSLTLALVFGFDNNQTSFVWSEWLINLLAVFILSLITIFVHTFAHKLVAYRYGGISQIRLWTMERYGWSKMRQLKRHMPIGIILAFFFTIFSNGQFPFAALESYELVSDKLRRVGRAFSYVTEYENAKIALAGPLANIFLAYIVKSFNYTGYFDTLIYMNVIFALYCMIPVSSLDGKHLYFNSKALFGFGFSFIVLSGLAVFYLSPLTALIISLILTLTIGSVYFYFRIFR